MQTLHSDDVVTGTFHDSVVEGRQWDMPSTSTEILFNLARCSIVDGECLIDITTRGKAQAFHQFLLGLLKDVLGLMEQI